MALDDFMDLTCDVLVRNPGRDAMGGTVREPYALVAASVPFAYQPRSGRAGRGAESLRGERVDGVAYFAADPGLAGGGRILRFVDRSGRLRSLELVDARDIASRGELITAAVREIAPVAL